MGLKLGAPSASALSALAPHTAVAAFVRKLQTAVSPAYVTAVGDSTGASPTGWLIELVRDKIAPAFPAYTVQSRDWDHTNQKYTDVPTVHQVGTAGARRYVATGTSTDKFFQIADTAATSPTGDIDVRWKGLLPSIGTTVVLASKYDTATNNRAWFLQVDASGKLNLFWSTDGLSGTQVSRLATVALPGAAVNAVVWLRATLDVDNGAAGHDVKFYYSTDGTTWTQVGSTVTTAGTTSIFDAAATTQVVGRGGTANTGGAGAAIEFHAFQLLTSLTAGSRPVIDFEASQWNGFGSLGTASAQFTDYVGNTITPQATGSTGSMAGAPVLTLLNGCVTGQAIAYATDGTRQPKLTPVPSDVAVINFSHNEVGNVAYRATYKSLADALIAKWPDVGILAVAQNPRTSPAANIAEHAIRIDQIRALAGSQRYALLDAYRAISRAGLSGNVATDGIHPTDAGYDVIREAAWALFSGYAA